MKKIFIVLVLTVGCSCGADDRVKIDARILAQIPEKRHAALVLYSLTDDDGSPGISEKTGKYIDSLKLLLESLRTAYYWHTAFPKEDINQAIDIRARYLAGFHYPASGSTGCSYYGSLVQSYTVKMYEEEIVTIAYAITERVKEQDVEVLHGSIGSFDSWLKAWVKAGEVESGPNQALLPTPTAVTPAATHPSRQP